VRPPVFAARELLHARHDRLRPEEGAIEVHGKHLAPRLGGRGLDLVVRQDAGVVHQHRDGSHLAHDRLVGLSHLERVADIAAHRHDGVSVRLDQRLQQLRPNVDHGHAAAPGQKGLHHAGPHGARGTGDDSDTAFEKRHDSGVQDALAAEQATGAEGDHRDEK
jgi:hypothetical protein